MPAFILPRHRRRFRVDGGRNRHRSYRPTLRRGRLQRRAGCRPRFRAGLRGPGRRDTGQLPLRRQIREGCRPPDTGRPPLARAALPQRDGAPQLPLLLALLHPAAVLRQAVVVHQDHGQEGQAHRRQRRDKLVPGAHQVRAFRRLAGEQRGLGLLPRALLGHATAGVALPELRPPAVHRQRAGAQLQTGAFRGSRCGAGTTIGRARPAPTVYRPDIYRLREVQGHHEAAAGRAGRLVRLRGHAGGIVGPRPPRPVQRAGRVAAEGEAAVPRRLHMRGG